MSSVLADRQNFQGGIKPLIIQADRNVAAVEVRLVALERQLQAAQLDLERALQPFSAEMTIDQAWRKHPQTRQVFARYHLPACDGCAVRFDETIAEAAAAYGLELSTLLEELNALL